MTLKPTLLITLLFLNFNLFAAEYCERENIFLENIRITRGTLSSTGRCFVGISQRNPENLTYRDFMFASDGLVMVFTSYGDGPSNTTTGAKEYRVYPRLQNPTYEILEDTVLITLSNGYRMTFDKNSAKPLELEGGNFKFDSRIIVGDQGGFNITDYNSLILDSGFSMGMNPTWTLSKKSTFTFTDGQKCTVSNKELFERRGDDNWPKYSDDESLIKFLTKRCK